MKQSDLDVYLRFNKLPSFISTVAGSHDYCRTQYWKESPKCADANLFSDFRASVDGTAVAAKSTVAAQGCGFCDQLFSSLDSDFVIRNMNGSSVSIARTDKEFMDLKFPAWVADSCKFIRVV